MIVLSWLAETHGASVSAHRRTLRYPPMLALSYDAALRCDAARGGGIEPESLAARIAPIALKLGPWTAWQAIGEVTSVPEVLIPLKFGVSDFPCGDIELRPTAEMRIDLGAASSGDSRIIEDAGSWSRPDHRTIRPGTLLRPGESRSPAMPESSRAHAPLVGRTERVRRAVASGVWGTVDSIPVQRVKDLAQERLAGELRRRAETALRPLPDAEPAAARVARYVTGVLEDASPAEVVSLSHGFDDEMIRQISFNTGLPTSIVRQSARELEIKIANIAPRSLR